MQKTRRRRFALALLITLMALGFRLFLALGLPNDEPDDGRVYEQIARNLLDRGVYSIETEPPYAPTYIRVPGYPLFLEVTYALFGRGANGAVRVVQAVLDTASCWLAALLAALWVPAAWGGERRRRAAVAALAIAALCPFTAIYVATILSESLAIFLLASFALAATLALRADDGRGAMGWWFAAGILGGAGTLVRPDGGLFVAAAGTLLLLLALRRAVTSRRRESADAAKKRALVVNRSLAAGLILCAGFALPIAPWTARNWLVLHRLQPLSPQHANMPGEFVPLGYGQWLRTWVTDEKEVEAVEWPLDLRPIPMERFPDSAFDSPGERRRVEALMERYNHPPQGPAKARASSAPIAPSLTVSPSSPPGQANAPADDDDDGDEAEPEANVLMTPEIDAGFASLAGERSSSHPLRTYLALPARRAISLWFDTHSRYYPFAGWLFPLSKLNAKHDQALWLPLFALLTWIYTILAAWGFWAMWRGEGTRRWTILLALLILPRLIFLSTMENPESRYVVEYFVLLAAAGGVALASLCPCAQEITEEVTP